ncbi:MAG: Mur ligase family protein [Hyphomonadaceae bacterium]|nr:Mur ligase family protein [Hyphomonadaceae bacterium]
MSDAALQRFEQLFGPEFGHGKAFDLALLHQALTALGAPHTKLPPVFHIAGTNGKGSTIAFLRAIAEAAGLSVHAFTKPHLHQLNERFLIAGRTASDDALIAAAERVRAHGPQLTQFDAQVAAALLLFSEAPADLVLLETGMGGRDDSTNVVNPALSILTPIGLDHQDALGPSIADIAAHKAGILKPKTWAITAQQSADVMDVIEAQAQSIGAPLWRQGVEWDAYANSGRLVVQTEQRTLDLPLPSLQGAHQIQNAGLAAASFLSPTPFDIPDEAFAQGIRAARWPGRLQPLSAGALAAPVRALGGEVWVDGGHNAHAAQALAHALAELQRKRAAPVALIIGMRARKDAAAFIAALAPSAQRIIAVPLSEAHIAPEQLAQLAREAGVEASTAPSLAAAMQNAAQLPAPRVLICGSLLLAAEALRD